MGREFLSPGDLFSGYLLPLEEHEGFSLWYGRRKYVSAGGKFTHFRGLCFLGAAATEEEILMGAEQILDEGGDLTETSPPKKKSRRKRKG